MKILFTCVNCYKPTKHNKVYKGVLWKHITQEEASQYPRGATEEIIKSVIVK